MATPLRVLIADDAAPIRLLLRAVLGATQDIAVVGEAADGAAAVRLAGDLLPDLVLLDLHMPQMDGREALPLIRQASPASRIVVLSGVDGAELGEAGAAADGVLPKGQPPAEILRVVREVAARPARGAPAAAGAGPATQVVPGAADLEMIGKAAAHDLKSPLQAILGFAHLLDDLYGAGLDDQGRQFLGTIISSTVRMGAMVEGLSVYSRAIAAAPAAGAVPLAQVVDRVREGLQAEIAQAGAEVAWTITSGEVLGDPGRVTTVLTALVRNALVWGVGTPHRVRVGVAALGDGAELSVEDAGPGIAADQRERMFGLFVTQPAAAGRAGVGLALCRRLVTGWGGTIQLNEAPGGGTRVTFTVPGATIGQTPPAPSAPQVVPPVAPLTVPVAGRGGLGVADGEPTVLLIEDSDDHAALVTASLSQAQRERYAVWRVCDLGAARRALATDRFACVLLDLSLPDGEGLESLTQILAVAPGIPVVVLTSRDDEAMAVAAVQRGAQDYVVKGVDSAILARAVRYAIERKSLEAQLAQQALHDPLTGLPNRTLLLARLGPALARARRTGERVAVLYLDLDSFKPINDQFGHDAGDAVLVEVASRLKAVVRPQDTVARIGGDEFAVLCDGFPADAEIHSLVARMADAVGSPLPDGIGDGVRRVTASIGAAFAGEADSPEDLIKMADEAMYREKRR